MNRALDPRSAGHVRFVPAATDAPPVETGTTNVVLDTAWTARTGDRPDVVGIRPYLSEVIEQRDLYEEALARLDAWAETAQLADRLIVEGVTYWYRMREPLWHWLHERLLWRHTLTTMLSDDRAATFSVPGDETALVDVLGVLAGQAPASLDVRGDLTGATDAQAISRRPGSLGGRLDRIVRRLEAGRRAPELRRREAILADRVAALTSGTAVRVVVLTIPAIHQRIGADVDRRRDPHLGSVIPRLADAGFEIILVGMGLDQRDDAAWDAVERDDHLLPQFLLRTRWSRPEDDVRVARAVASVDAALDDARGVPLDLDGIDLAGPLMDELRARLDRTIANDVHQLARIERFIAEVRPSAILLTQEGIRTPWLMAGARAGVAVHAVQHGVLYPTHPGYPDRRHPELVLPTRTFVYGDYERRVLLALAYRPNEVEASGSPRLDLDAAVGGGGDGVDDRTAVRAELGVAEGHSLLVVSTLHVEFVRRAHLVHMLARTLGGPLPGIHVVFKQHPGERDPGPYRALLGGLAAAGGYDPPPMTVVKDIDLYRLLRAADAHLGLHSTMLTDAVAAGTPNLIAIVEGHADLLGYVAAGVARPVRDVVDVRSALADPEPPNPSARQAFLDDHFRSGDASARIAASIGRSLAERGGSGAAAVGRR